MTKKMLQRWIGRHPQHNNVIFEIERDPAPCRRGLWRVLRVSGQSWECGFATPEDAMEWGNGLCRNAAPVWTKDPQAS